MQLVIIDASPKRGQASNSGYFANEIGNILETKAQIIHLRVDTPSIREEDVQQLREADAILFCFPVYVDQLPSHLLHVLCELEGVFRGEHTPKVYAVANCGFFEGEHCLLALDIMQHWAARAGLGCGEMLGGLEEVPLGKGPKKNLAEILRLFTQSVQKLKSGKHIYSAPNFARFLYMQAGNHGFKKEAKRNGLRVKDLYRAE